MSTRHNNPRPLRQGSRVAKAPASDSQPLLATTATTGRVVVFEAISAAQDIIRVSIETARAARLPEQVIVF